jgi:hypothetical protein
MESETAETGRQSEPGIRRTAAPTPSRTFCRSLQEGSVMDVGFIGLGNMALDLLGIAVPERM